MQYLKVRIVDICLTEYFWLNISKRNQGQVVCRVPYMRQNLMYMKHHIRDSIYYLNLEHIRKTNF